MQSSQIKKLRELLKLSSIFIADEKIRKRLSSLYVKELKYFREAPSISFKEQKFF